MPEYPDYRQPAEPEQAKYRFTQAGFPRTHLGKLVTTSWKNLKRNHGISLEVTRKRFFWGGEGPMKCLPPDFGPQLFSIKKE